ncbi:MAG TPA: hypothetical protein IAA22_04680 [Candidatus Olsenella stercoravium]|uniref:Uncharacterized protein n=1 Tax=Candidatus Olsenella stercoravium TaxID=2838713 RepID=A0A9D2IPV1_9ACTN|nr:hypothetical protein [Candidatus Olsenella stercoravium]
MLVTGDVLLDPASFRKLAVAITAAAVVLLAFWAIGRRRRGVSDEVSRRTSATTGRP